MRSLILIASLTAALPAFAQNGGWTSNNYGGPGTYYNGTGANSGWRGYSNSYGGPGTYSTFTGPNGQHQNCYTSNYGGPTTYTNCN